jgi:hypothetical protein
LLALAASQGFDSLLRKDENLPYEQNLSNLPIAVVILRAPSNDMDDIRPVLLALFQALSNCRQNRYFMSHKS